MDKKIDYNAFMTVMSKATALNLVREQLASFSQFEPPYLSDFYINLDRGGCFLLEGLAEQEKRESRVGGKPYQWKLLCIQDEWGDVPQPGDMVTRVIPVNRKDMEGKPVSGDVLTAAKRDGSFSNRFEQRNKYPVDDKGCITVGFTDAGYFLTKWGVHGGTGYAITEKPELSPEPVRYGNGTKHVRYRRYSEQDKEMYAKLPTLTAKEPAKGGEKKEK